jgi:hypothetical protein
MSIADLAGQGDLGMAITPEGMAITPEYKQPKNPARKSTPAG